MVLAEKHCQCWFWDGSQTIASFFEKELTHGFFLNFSIEYIGFLKKVAKMDEVNIKGIGTANAADLMEEAKGVVERMARRYAGRGVSVVDLEGEGYLALLEAAHSYDPARGPFAAFASPVVRQRMERVAETMGGIYSVPRGVAAEAERRRSRALSVDAPLGGREGMTLLDFVAGADGGDAAAALPGDAQALLLQLEGRERAVIEGLFGIGRERLSMAALGEELGLKRERVRQVRDKALRKLAKLARGAAAKGID